MASLEPLSTTSTRAPSRAVASRLSSARRVSSQPFQTSMIRVGGAVPFMAARQVAGAGRPPQRRQGLGQLACARVPQLRQRGGGAVRWPRAAPAPARASAPLPAPAAAVGPSTRNSASSGRSRAAPRRQRREANTASPSRSRTSIRACNSGLRGFRLGQALHQFLRRGSHGGIVPQGGAPHGCRGHAARLGLSRNCGQAAARPGPWEGEQRGEGGAEPPARARCDHRRRRRRQRHRRRPAQARRDSSALAANPPRKGSNGSRNAPSRAAPGTGRAGRANSPIHNARDRATAPGGDPQGAADQHEQVPGDGEEGQRGREAPGRAVGAQVARAGAARQLRHQQGLGAEQAEIPRPAARPGSARVRAAATARAAASIAAFFSRGPPGADR